MDNSPSLLDFGIYRLQRDLQEWGLLVLRYDWDKDEIVITLTQWTKTAEGMDALRTEEECRDFIGEIRRFGGYTEGKLWPVLAHSTLSDRFSHEGYVRGDAEAYTSRMLELDKKFTISCLTEQKKFEGPLVGTEIAVTERR